MPNMLTDFWAVKLQAILVFFFVLFITFQIWGSEQEFLLRSEKQNKTKIKRTLWTSIASRQSTKITHAVSPVLTLL